MCGADGDARGNLTPSRRGGRRLGSSSLIGPRFQTGRDRAFDREATTVDPSLAIDFTPGQRRVVKISWDRDPFRGEDDTSNAERLVVRRRHALLDRADDARRPWRPSATSRLPSRVMPARARALATRARRRRPRRRRRGASRWPPQIRADSRRSPLVVFSFVYPSTRRRRRRRRARARDGSRRSRRAARPRRARWRAARRRASPFVDPRAPSPRSSGRERKGKYIITIY